MKRLGNPPTHIKDFAHVHWVSWFKRITSIYEWQSPTFTNSWDNVGGSYYNAAYVKDAWNRVRLRGRIDTGASTSAAFTLPAEFRPNATMHFVCDGTNNSGIATARVSITSSGVLTPTISGTSIEVSLDGICFIAEA